MPAAQQAAPTPPVQDAEVPGGQAAVAAPPPEPAPDLQQAARQVRAAYADATSHYNDGIYRLHSLNGAGMFMDGVSIDLDAQNIAALKAQCSRSDQPQVQALIDDLVSKSTDLQNAAESSPTGGK